MAGGKKSYRSKDILSFIQYIRNFTQPVNQLAQISNVLQSTAAAAGGLRFLDEKEEEEGYYYSP